MILLKILNYKTFFYYRVGESEIDFKNCSDKILWIIQLNWISLTIQNWYDEAFYWYEIVYERVLKIGFNILEKYLGLIWVQFVKMPNLVDIDQNV